MCRHSANLGDLQGRAARSLLDTAEECFYPFLNRFYQFLTTPQMHLVNIQCDNAPERALHLTGEEEEEEDHPDKPVKGGQWIKCSKHLMSPTPVYNMTQ